MKTQYEQFNHIDITHPKVHKIINCAFEVFSKNDLEKASTNQIVKLAGISRGLLYHYFKDKQDLYDFLIFIAMKVGVVEMNEKINWDEQDFIKRMIMVTRIRFEIMSRYPYMTSFFQKYTYQLNKNELRELYDELNPGMREKFYSYNLDFSRLKEGVEKDKMIKVVRWTVKGKVAEWNEKKQAGEKVADVNAVIAECIDYLEFLRNVFYRKEGIDET